MIRPTNTNLAAFAAALAIPAAATAHGVDLPTTCTAEADAAIDEGMGLLHNMMYIQAEAAFAKAADSDPDCAMAEWGIAMSNFHPLWPGMPTAEETERGVAAAERLTALTPGSDLEKAFADAAE